MAEHDEELLGYYVARIKRYRELRKSILSTYMAIIYGSYWMEHSEGLALLEKAKRCLREELGMRNVYLVKDLSGEQLGIDPELVRNAQRIRCEEEVQQLTWDEKGVCGKYFLEKSIKSLRKADIAIFFAPKEPVKRSPQGVVVELTYLETYMSQAGEETPQILVLVDPEALESATSLLYGVLERLQEKGADIVYDLAEKHYADEKELCNLLKNHVERIIHKTIIKNL